MLRLDYSGIRRRKCNFWRTLHRLRTGKRKNEDASMSELLQQLDADDVVVLDHVDEMFEELSEEGMRQYYMPLQQACRLVLVGDRLPEIQGGTTIRVLDWSLEDYVYLITRLADVPEAVARFIAKRFGFTLTQSDNETWFSKPVNNVRRVLDAVLQACRSSEVRHSDDNLQPLHADVPLLLRTPGPAAWFAMLSLHEGNVIRLAVHSKRPRLTVSVLYDYFTACARDRVHSTSFCNMVRRLVSGGWLATPDKQVTPVSALSFGAALTPEFRETLRKQPHFISRGELQ
jgi:hypothetical protein